MVEYNYSIIIPHKDIPDLLLRCIRSVPRRDDVQIIVVDDNSEDGDKYFELYPEFTRSGVEFYFTTLGKGAGYARNVGLSHAKGKWVIFADADDFFTEELSSILDECVNRDEDILFFKISSVMSEDINIFSDKSSYINPLLERNIPNEIIGLMHVVWSKFYKRSFLVDKKVRFDEVMWSNDQYFSAITGLYAKTYSIIDKVLYVTTKRRGSLTYSICSTRKELRCRAAVSIRTFYLLISHGNTLGIENVIFYLRISLNELKDKRTAIDILHSLPLRYYPLAFETLCIWGNWKYKLYITSFFLLAFLFGRNLDSKDI